MQVYEREEKHEVGELDIVVLEKNKQDFISLTDMARYRDPERTDYIIQNWLRSRAAIEFCGLWEQLNNPDFKPIDFDGFKNDAGSNSFVLTPQKWIKSTNAMGMISKSGRYGGGTFAHKDIAFEFGTWLSSEFKLYLIREFQRLKEAEGKQNNLDWNFQRHLAKVNYRIHTDAIKENLIPATLNRKQINFVYASEADLLNMALYGMTAREWREANPNEKGNVRDHSTMEQLIVLSNLESLNAVLVAQTIAAPERLEQLNVVAIAQMKSLVRNMQLAQLNEGVDRVEEDRAEYKTAS